MASRFWVGGTAKWDATVGSKWSTTSGGAGGSAVPTVSDDVFLDAASGAVTVTIDMAALCQSLNCTGFTGTLNYDSVAGTKNLTIGSSFTPPSNIALKFVAGMTYTATASNTLTFTGNQGSTQSTITTAGKTMPNTTFNDTAGSWKLLDSFTATGATISLVAGVLDTNGQTVNCSTLTVTGSATRTLTLGASAINCSAPTFRGNGLTISSNTAVLTVTAGSPTFNVTNLLVNFNGMSVVLSGAGVANWNAIAGCTIANLTVIGTALKTDSMIFAVDVTITGTLTLGGNSTQGVNRQLVWSGAAGTLRTVTMTGGAVVISGDVDFMDIAITGSPSWTNTGSAFIGDALGNGSLITTNRTTPATRYWVATSGTTAWSTSNWSTSAGGSSGARVPLPQDDVVLDTTMATGTISLDMPRAGANLTATTFTRPFSFGAPSVIYGSVTFGAGVTPTGTNGFTLAGRGSHTITSAGVTWTPAVTINAPGGTYTLQDAFTDNRTANFLVVANGTFDSNDFAVTSSGNGGAFTQTGGILDMGASVWVFATTSTQTIWAVTGGTIVPGTSEIIISTASSSTRTFGGFGKTYGKLTYTVADSPGALAITGNNVFKELNIGSGRQVTLPATGTQWVNNWNGSGQDFDYVRLPGVSGHYISVPDSAALSITGDLDIRARVNLADWTPAAATMFVAKLDNAARRSYQFYLNTNGTMAVSLSTTGSSQAETTASTATGITDGTSAWVRVTRRLSDGRVQFFKAADSPTMPSSWTQIGTDQTGTTSALADTTSMVELGTSQTGTGFLAPVALQRAQIRSNILDDGTGIVFDADLDTKAVGADTFTESSSNGATVTVNGALAQAGDGRLQVVSGTANSPAFLARTYDDGLGNLWAPVSAGQLEINSDHIRLPAITGTYIAGPSVATATDLDIRMKLSMDDWTPNALRTLASKYDATSAATEDSWILFTNSDSSGKLYFTYYETGGTARTLLSSVGTGFTDGTTNWVRVTLDVDNGSSQSVVKFWTSSDGVSWTQLGSSQTQGFVSSLRNTPALVELGRDPLGAGVSPLAGNIYRFQQRNNILDDGTGIVANFDATKPTYETADYLAIKDVQVSQTDTFDRLASATTLGSSDYGDAWTAQQGTWGTTGGQGYAPVLSSSVAVASVTGSVDQTVQAQLVTISGNLGVVARCADASNYYLVYHQSLTVQIFKRVAGTNTQLGADISATRVANEVLGIRVTGTTIEALLNGVVIGSRTDSALTAGTGAGLYSEHIGNRFDNFHITGKPTTPLWYAGSHSVDKGNGYGWQYTDAPSAPSAQGNFFLVL